MPGFQSFFSVFLHHFVLAKLATSSIRMKPCRVGINWIALAKHSDEYPCARLSVFFLGFFASFCIGKISHEQH